MQSQSNDQKNYDPHFYIASGKRVLYNRPLSLLQNVHTTAKKLHANIFAAGSRCCLPDICADFLGRKHREQNFRCFAEAHSRLLFPQFAGEHAHPRVNQVSSATHRAEHRKRVLVIPGLL